MSSVKLVKDTNKKDKNINKKKIAITSVVAILVVCIVSFILYQSKVFGPTERQIIAEAKEVGLSVDIYKNLRTELDKQVTAEDLKEIESLTIQNIEDMTGISNIPNLEKVVVLNQDIAPSAAVVGTTHVHEDGTVHEVTEVGEYEKINLSELGSLDSLKSIILYGDNFNYETFFDNIENPENIETFTISDSSIKSLVGIERLVNLKELDITHCYELSNIDDISNLKNLTSLRLHGSYTLIDSISELTNLKNMFISSTTLDLNELSKLYNLETLIVCANTLYNTDEFSKLENLKDLSIANADITEIPYMDNIEKLYLQDLDSMISLDSVKELKNVKQLELVNMDGLEKEALDNLKTELNQLENLSIRNCEKLNSEKKEITLNNID